jgi:hypothetical protein
MQQRLSLSRSELIEDFAGRAPWTFGQVVVQVARPGELVADGIKGKQ